MSFTSEDFAKRHYGPACKARLVTIRFGRRPLRVNARAARAFKRMRRVFMENNPDFFRKLDEGILNDWSFACRPISGSSRMSNHSYGIAVDWNANENYRGLRGESSQVWRHARDSILKLESEGVFNWGGRWDDPDAMHFEVALSPEQLRNKYTRTGKLKRKQRRKAKRKQRRSRRRRRR